MSLESALKKAVEESIKLYSNPPPLTDTSSLSVTDIARCTYLSYLSRTRPKPTLDMEALYGIQVHARFLGILRVKMEQELKGMKCTSEDEIKVTEKVYGKVDLACLNDKEAVVLELKVTENLYNTNPFTLFHIRQLKYYMYYYHKLVSSVTGILLYIKPNLSDYRYRLLWIQNWEEVEREIAEREKAIKAGGIKEKGPWCKYCIYKRECGTTTLV